MLREVGDAQQQIAKLAATLVSTGAAASTSGGIDPLLALKADAARQPQPLGRWLTELAASAIALRSGDPRLQLATIFNASGGPAELCPAVVNGRYPFAPSATDDVPLADFARLFAPGGAFDGFVNTLLRRYVDTSGKTWRLLSADAASAPVSAADLAQFQRAAAIRDAFFADGGTRPRFRLDITPVSADAATRQVTLDLDGTTIVYTRGAQRSTQVTWPGFSLQPTMRLVFDPPPVGRAGEVRESGPWALFRLLGRGRMQAQAGDCGSLYADVPARRTAGGVRCAGAGCGQSAGGGGAAGVSLSERAGELISGRRAVRATAGILRLKQRNAAEGALMREVRDILPAHSAIKSDSERGANMAQVLVRNLDEHVVAALRRKAELHGHSLEQELRLALTSAARLTPAERVALARRVRSLTPANIEQTDSTDLIRQDRDSR